LAYRHVPARKKTTGFSFESRIFAFAFFDNSSVHDGFSATAHVFHMHRSHRIRATGVAVKNGVRTWPRNSCAPTVDRRTLLGRNSRA
jgi:hypothetical protein